MLKVRFWKSVLPIIPCERYVIESVGFTPILEEKCVIWAKFEELVLFHCKLTLSDLFCVVNHSTGFWDEQLLLSPLLIFINFDFKIEDTIFVSDKKVQNGIGKFFEDSVSCNLSSPTLEWSFYSRQMNNSSVTTYPYHARFLLFINFSFVSYLVAAKALWPGPLCLLVWSSRLSIKS